MSLDIYLLEMRKTDVHWQNITHNLGKMADEAGFYDALWHPEKEGIKTAKDLIPHLGSGIAKMRARPEFYKQFDAPNGWGTYDVFLPWLEKLLAACKEHPNARVEVSI